MQEKRCKICSVLAGVSKMPCFETIDGGFHGSFDVSNTLAISLKPTMQEMNQSCTFDVIFGVLNSIDPRTVKMFNFYLNSSTISRDMNLKNNAWQQSIPVRFNGKLQFDGFPKHQSIWPNVNLTATQPQMYFDSPLDYSSSLQNYFTIVNRGNFMSLPHLSFLLQWPAFVWLNETLKMDLLLVDSVKCFSHSNKVPCSCDVPTNETKADIFQENFPASNISFVLLENLTEAIKKCRDTFENCYVNITCEVQELPKSDVLNISIRSLISPFIMANFQKPVMLTSKASIFTDEDYPVNITFTSGSFVQVTNKLMPLHSYNPITNNPDPFRLPWWAILLSVLCGLLLLALIAYGCKRAGFFTNKYSKMKQEAMKQDPAEREPLK